MGVAKFNELNDEFKLILQRLLFNEVDILEFK